MWKIQEYIQEILRKYFDNFENIFRKYLRNIWKVLRIYIVGKHSRNILKKHFEYNYEIFQKTVSCDNFLLLPTVPAQSTVAGGGNMQIFLGKSRSRVSQPFLKIQQSAIFKASLQFLTVSGEIFCRR